MNHDERQAPGPPARRQALKVLAAATGAAALSTLPVRWSKAGLQFGTLPVHAHATGLHSVASCGADVVGEPDSDALTSSCTITPVHAGISMHYSIAFTNAAFDGADASSGDTLTNGSGIASVTTGPISATNSTGSVVFTWTFTNPSDGTGSCTQTFAWTTS